jgi:glucose/arabinose dehydrogenase
MRHRTPLIPVAAAALALVATAFAAPANAATDPDVVADGLVSPLSVAVADDGTVFVSQNFASLLTKVAPGADPELIFADEGQREVGALSVSGDVVTFATTGQQDSKLWTLDAEGNQTQVADLWAYESSHNPDGKTTYGIGGLSKSCKKDFKKKVRFMLPYKGGKDSHPYSSYVDGATTYVADAGANAILAVTDGTVSTVAKLPATSIKITKKIRKAVGLPRCAQGKNFRAEGVPTDVELGPDGNLYVTSLPGGPEDPSMGANGGVYRIVPSTGDITKVATGLMSPVGLAIAPDGTVFISLLFPGLILEKPLGGDAAVFAEVPFPGDIDYKNGDVYATQTDLTNSGQTPPAGQVLRWAVTPS